MNVIELKKSVHKAIDEIDNPVFLLDVYEIILNNQQNEVGIHWNQLNVSQQNEIIEIDNGLANGTIKLTPHEEVVKQNAKWLKN